MLKLYQWQLDDNYCENIDSYKVRDYVRQFTRTVGLYRCS